MDDPTLEQLIEAQQQLLTAQGLWNENQRQISNSLASPMEDRDRNLDTLITESEKLTCANLRLLARICAKIGFPHKGKVGAEAAHFVETIMRQCQFSDPQSLNSVMDSVLQCDPSSFQVPSKAILARFHDKAMVTVSGSQLYGFSFTDLIEMKTREKTRVPFPILNVGEVDQRRKTLGLKPLYLHALDLQDIEPEIPIMLPVGYLMRYAPEAFKPPRIPDSLPIQGPSAEWREVSGELLARQKRFSHSKARVLRPTQSRPTSTVAMSQETDQLLEENFDYVVALCAKTTLGFPTDQRVGLQAAQFAWQTVRDYSRANSSQLTTIYNSLLKAYEEFPHTGFPHIEELSWLLDTREVKDRGFQIFGSLWSVNLGFFNAIVPVPVERIDNLDDRRRRGALTAWIQQAQELEESSSLPVYLPLEYFKGLIEKAY